MPGPPARPRSWRAIAQLRARARDRWWCATVDRADRRPSSWRRIADQLRQAIDSAARIDRREHDRRSCVPELDGADTAAELARAELAVRAACGSARCGIGVATAPFDGIDADTVIGCVRAMRRCCRRGGRRSGSRRDVATTIAAGRTAKIRPRGSDAMHGEALRPRASGSRARPSPVLIEGETGTGKELVARRSTR